LIIDAVYIIFTFVIATAKIYPTYGDLLILLGEAEQQSDNVAHSLAKTFASLYPHIPVAREDTLLKTIQRLAAPTRPSTLGPCKLQGLALQQYKDQIWKPRIRHKKGQLKQSTIPIVSISKCDSPCKLGHVGTNYTM